MIFRHLREFTGLTQREVLRKFALGSLPIQEEWVEKSPSTPEEITRFYRETDGYLWDLSQWHMLEQQRVWDDKFADRIRGSGAKYVLDYGCGVGVHAINLARRGIKVVAADLPSRTLDFLKYRIAHLHPLGQLVTVLELDSDGRRWLNDHRGEFDVVICLDVLEHMPTREAALALARKLKSYGKRVIYAIHTGRNNGAHPMHLPHDPALEEDIRRIFEEDGDSGDGKSSRQAPG